jgi:hypothetical protein
MYKSLEVNMNKKAILDFILLRYENDDKVSKEIIEDIKAAIMEMEIAQSMFNSVSDPKLVEAAIYREEAAKRKFEYLISLAKEKRINNNMDI